MGYSSVVENATEDIDKYGDDENEAKDAAWTNAPGFVRLGMGTRVDGTSLEEVGAFIRISAHKGDGGLRASGITVA